MSGPAARGVVVSLHGLQPLVSSHHTPGLQVKIDLCLTLCGPLVPACRPQVKEIDPGTGEAEEEGYDDEYVLEDLEVRGRGR